MADRLQTIASQLSGLPDASLAAATHLLYFPEHDSRASNQHSIGLSQR